MTMREGNSKPPPGTPSTGRTPSSTTKAPPEGDGAHLRHLPRLPPLRQPVQALPHPVRPGRRSTTMEVDGVPRRLLEGGRPVLPVRPVLHDQVPLRAAARVEPGLPAHHAARQGDQVQEGRGQFREKLLASTDVHGSLPAFPVVVQVVNAVNKKPARAVMDKTAGRAQGRLAARAGDAASSAPMRAQKKPASGERRPSTPGKVAIFSTCYVNYNEPGIGHDLLKVLDHNEIPYVLVEKETCCGMPKLELGDLDTVEKHKEANIPCWREAGPRGLRHRHAGAQLHADVQAGAAADVPGRRRRAGGQGGDVRPLRVPDARHKDGLLKTDFKPLGKVSATTSPATAGCRTSARRPRRCSR
jgi:hypothetical protein